MSTLFTEYEGALDIRVPARDYQVMAVDNAFDALLESNSTLIVMATALGKTRVAALFASRALPHGDILFLAHREELINQAVATFRELLPGVSIGVERAEDTTEHGDDAPRIVVASTPTLSEPERLAKFSRDRFRWIIIDEGHHFSTVNKSYVVIVDYFGMVKIIGLTATPRRGDRVSLGYSFGSVCFRYGLLEGIDDGWLVPIVQKYVWVEDYDLSQVNAGEDLNQHQLDQVICKERPLVGICQAAVDYSNAGGGKRQTMIFAPGVLAARRIAEMLNRWHAKNGSGMAAAVDCKATKAIERREINRLYKAREIRYLVNFGIFFEGYDSPETEVVVIARTTQLWNVYTQMIGRGMRPSSDIAHALNLAGSPEARKALIASSQKPCCTIVDLVGVTGKHKLISTPDIMDGRAPDQVVEKAKELIKSGEVDDVLQAMKRSKWIFDENQAKARAGVLVAAHLKSVDVDPRNVFDVKLMKKNSTKRTLPATEPQLKALARAGVSKAICQLVGFAEAKRLLDWITSRRELGLCSVKQMKILRQFGYDPTETSFQEASQIIGRLEANGWRRI